MVHPVRLLLILLLRIRGGLSLRKEVLVVLETLQLSLEFVACQSRGRNLFLDRLVFLILGLRVVCVLHAFGLSFILLLDFFHRGAGSLQVRIVAGALDPGDIRLFLRLFWFGLRPFLSLDSRFELFVGDVPLEAGV